METINQARRGLLDIEGVRATYPKWSEANLRLRAEWPHTRDDTAIAETVRGSQDEQIHSDLPALGMPTLPVVAGKGGGINDADISEVRNLLPGIALRKIEHSRYMIPFDDLEAFLESMQGFLASG